jgi:hypothetical protein
MPDSTDDLRSTEQAISLDAEAVQAMEEKKQQLDPADPRVRDLSRRVKDVTAQMDAKAAAEEELSEQIES